MVVMGVQVVTGDSQEEVIIFRDRQTDRQTLHHYIYIIIMIIVITQGHVSGGRISVENPEFGFLEVSSRPHSVPQAFGPDRDDDDDVVDNDDGDDDD